MIRTSLPGGHHFAMMEAGEILGVALNNQKWMQFQTGIHAGVLSIPELHRKMALGDEKYVERSSAYLKQIEDQVPTSRAWRNVDDVVGCVPNVPAFLAGHPQHMRRRERAMRETAPLTIFMDLTSSMGIPPEQILRRGLVLLALARLLVEHRPVELWVGTSLNGGGVYCTAAWRIDTAPMDLARAAFHVSDPAMSRLFGYATCEMLVGQHVSGHPHDSEKKYVERLRHVAGWHDVMYLPPIRYGTDEMTSNPVQWLKTVMAKYLPSNEEAA